MDVWFFSSPIGLGHAARDAAIADMMRGTDAGFVSGGAAARMLGEAGLDVRDEYRPPAFSVRDGRLEGAAWWLWRYYRYYRRCRKIAARVLDEATPGLVVADEDLASLAVAQERGIPTVLITDVLGTRFAPGPASIMEGVMNRAMRAIMGRCEAVIMPEHGDDAGNIRRVGPVVRDAGGTREELRAEFGLEGEAITVSVGGTDAGLYLAGRAVEAASRSRPDAGVVAVSGPSACGGFGGARNLGYVPNMHELVYASDLVIAPAGRSTMDEAAAYGTPGIFVPIAGHFEQEDNAARLGSGPADADRLEELIPRRLDGGRGPRQEAPGAAGAAGIIRGILDRGLSLKA